MPLARLSLLPAALCALGLLAESAPALPRAVDPAPDPSPVVAAGAFANGPSFPGGAPALSAITFEPNPNERAPLVLFVRATTDVPARAVVHLDGGLWPLTVTPSDELATDHDLIVLGAHADTDYQVTLEVIDADGASTTSEPFAWTTPPLPDDFPPMHVTVSRPSRMEPGVTLIPANRWAGRGPPQQDGGALFALDARGDVVWFFDAPWPVTEAKPRSNGNLLLYHGSRGNIVELDMTGAIVQQWYTTRLPGTVAPDGGIPIDAGTIHHEVIELPSGNLMALSTEQWLIEDYPTSESDPAAPWGASWVVGDLVLELSPDGEVLRRIDLMDILDPLRIGYESLDPGFWKGVYTGSEEAPLRDWSHANSIHYDAARHEIIVSCYHLDTVFAYDLDADELSWMVSFPDGWDDDWQPYLLAPKGDGLYPFHQHAARLTPKDTLLMFDNGKYRARPFQQPMAAADSFSRAVEFKIDREAMTFEQVWSYGGRPDEIFFTAFLGETDWLPETGHVLITDGGRIRTPDGRFGVHPNQGQKWARVLEVTHDEPAEVVFEVVFDDPTWGWTVYRSERLSSLYAERRVGR